jgi:NAD-dependent SIR2 family protein deacetylase
VVALKNPTTVLSCDECEWFGDDPKWVDTKDTFQPPRGEVPQCPLCDSLKLTLFVIE